MAHHSKELSLHLSGLQRHVTRSSTFFLGQFQGGDVTRDANDARDHSGTVGKRHLRDRGPNGFAVLIALLFDLVDHRFAGEHDALFVFVKLLCLG